MGPGPPGIALATLFFSRFTAGRMVSRTKADCLLCSGLAGRNAVVLEVSYHGQAEYRQAKYTLLGVDVRDVTHLPLGVSAYNSRLSKFCTVNMFATGYCVL